VSITPAAVTEVHPSSAVPTPVVSRCCPPQLAPGAPVCAPG
jgi:hypothetical protein